ncbi:hydrolase [Sulfolobus sp. S-194]|uniref:MBL fold metallo-hydrolase n=1 Tax=Sulfolobus sp. S-194 TaxID=2512240 RepID=UPI0014371669|nr:MBL fold metallo-hydrolase [Sulfolobus sp. S-194]QIW23402.1 hydrolase [Sulfolobus sp. S-194]
MIKFFYHSSFLLDNKILLDPHDGGSIGLPRPETKADLILITHNHYDHNAYEIIPHKDVKIKYYGEFNYASYTIEGLKAYHDKEKGKRRGETAIYKIINSNGKLIVHMGDIGHMPDEQILEKIRNPDILMIPVGGVITINALEAKEIIDKLNPKITIPMHYWVKGHFMPLDPLDNFLEVVNRKIIETREKEVDENSIEKGSVLIFKV